MSRSSVWGFLVVFASGHLGRWAAARTALLLIDVQDCFLDNGSLAVPAKQIVPVINKVRQERDCLFDLVVLTQDFHPKNHLSFGSTHGLPPFSHLGGKGGLPITCLRPTSNDSRDAACCPTQHVDPSSVDCTTKLCPPSNWSWASNNSAFVSNNSACAVCRSEPSRCFNDTQAMWTDHCLQSGDSNFPSSMVRKTTDIIVQKGENIYVDAYSGFMDNSKNLKTSLDSTLRAQNVTTLFIAGIATDICVLWTTLDALSNLTRTYNVTVISDMSAGLPVGKTPTALHEEALVKMKQAGAVIVSSADLLARSCPARTPVSSARRAAPTPLRQAAASAAAVAVAMVVMLAGTAASP